MLLELGMIPQDTVSLVALSSCLAALTGALSRRPAAATTRAVRRSIVDDLLFGFGDRQSFHGGGGYKLFFLHAFHVQFRRFIFFFYTCV